MLKVFYEVYWDDRHIEYRENVFQSLGKIADWIFDMMKCDYTGKNNFSVLFPREQNGAYPKEPTVIRFRPSPDAPDYTIRKITDGDSIIYTDGTYTCRRKFWTGEVREWCRQCEERRKNPSFNFADNATPKSHRTPASDPVQAEQGQNAYVVCYRESCVRDMEVCTKDPAEANPIGDEWVPVDSAKLFVGIYIAGSDAFAVEAAAKAEGCDKACLEAILVSKPVAGRTYHVYLKGPEKQQANVRSCFKRKKSMEPEISSSWQGLRHVMDIHAESGIQAVELVSKKLGWSKDILVAVPKYDNI